MAIWQVFLLFGVGSVAGFINVMAGGGSLLTLPVMVFMGLPGPTVNGTNRIAILAQNISATISFFRHGYRDLRLSLSLTACALPGTVLGAMAGTRLEGVWFNRTLACVMIVVLLLMSRKSRASTSPDEGGSISRRRFVLAHLGMVLVGLYGGFIQAGVGFLLMAILHRVLGLDLVRVNMHKVFIIGVYTVLAVAIFAAEGQIFWAAGVALALGNATGGWIGVHFAVAKGDRIIRVVFRFALVAMAVKLLLG